MEMAHQQHADTPANGKAVLRYRWAELRHQ